MARHGSGTLHWGRAIFALSLVILLMGATMFSAGAAPFIRESEEVLQEDVEPSTPPMLDPEEQEVAEDSGELLDSEEIEEPLAPQLETDLDLPAQEMSKTEQLLQSLDQLNATLSPLAAGDDTCNNADPGTGAYAETLCWLDFSGFTTAYEDTSQWWQPSNWQSVMGSAYTAGGRSGNWGNIQNYPVNVDLGGGYVLSARLDVTGNAAGKQVVANRFPTYTNAFLGNRNFYTGVGGSPALYQTGNGGETSLILKDIELKRGDTLLRDYSIVVADAESTDTNEWINWTTTGAGFRWLPNTPPGGSKSNVMGNACTTATPGWNSTTPATTASCNGGASGNKSGTAMLATAPPSTGSFQITQRMKGNGLQGVAFGVIIARAAVQTSVTDRIVNSSNQAADQTNFTGTILQTAGNTQVATTETGTSALQSPEGTSALPVSTSGTQLRFTSVASGTLASSYRSAWRCERTNPANGTTSYWPSQTTTSPTPPAPSDPFTLLSVGQYLKCNIEYTPPYLTLLKEVDNGATAATHTAADFTLQATRQVSPVSMIQGPGNQAAAVTKRAVAIGLYTLQETSPNPETQGNWPYGYDWTNLVCAPEPGSTALGAFTTTSEQDGTVAAGSLQINAGNNVVCTYHNVAREPQLEAEKAVFDASGNIVDRDSAVNANETISYKLTFRNSGTATMDLDYRDYLGDVLDDAQFVTNSVRISNGEETAYPSHMDNPGIVVTEQLNQADPQLGITGTVQRGQTRTVWFRVTVLSNQENAGPRQEGTVRSSDEAPDQVGYMLSNYLLPAGSPVPQACPEPAPGESSSCTQHPIPAWSVAKDSRPADGARLHKGGNTHYQITATKMNAATLIEDLVFEDDLTHVFKTAGWAPGAAVPGGALKRGIYFFDENDQALDAAGGPVGTVAAPVAAFDENSGYVPEPTFDGVTGRWTIRSLPVTLPINAVRAEMWFAVEAGQLPANIPPSWPEDSNPAFGSRYVNYVRAQAQDALLPNQCSLATTNAPNTGFSPTAPTPQDVDFPEACRVIHQMSDNYFTIRKDARGAGVEFPDSVSGWGDPTGLTNMVGHEFEIRDDQGGAPTDHPSVKLCRAEYNPTIWDGNFISGGTPDWGEDSATLAAIIAHNNTLPAESPDELPLCGLFYPQGTFSGQPHAGGQDGRWRSEYLSEGDYWLVETKAPQLQINNAGTEQRPVPGVQLLAQPISFRVWPEADAPVFGDPPQSMEGRGQLDIRGLKRQRCSPGAPVGERPVACVNPTGYLMIVQDVVPIAMPLTGGKGTTWLIVAGSGVITASVIGLWLWRRNQSRRIIGGENPM